MTAILNALLFFCGAALVGGATLVGIKSGRLSARPGVVVKKEDSVFMFHFCTLLFAMLAALLLAIAGLFVMQAVDAELSERLFRKIFW